MAPALSGALDAAPASLRFLPREDWPGKDWPGQGDGPISVGLVNNMPDAALRSTEQQFRMLLAAASQGRTVHLRLFSLPGAVRTEAARAHLRQHYESFDALCASRLDGLIVTGTEPRARELTDEPYWPALARLVDWVEGRAMPAIWSCLAAHAAVLHLDGIGRRRLPRKLSGVFDCTKAADHAVLGGVESSWRVPHSRYNEVPEEALAAKGYCILSRSHDAGADIFARPGTHSLFLQGHPEYGPETLLREYYRDIGRFLAGERDGYPEMPCGTFDEGAEAALAAFRGRALRERTPDLLPDFPVTASRGLTHPWRDPAVRLYANWLSCLAERRSRSPGAAWVPGDQAAVL